MLKLQGQTCLVVGGGRIALRKAAGLLEAGAAVRVVSPRFDPAFEELGVELVGRTFEPGDLEDVFLVVAATDQRETNRLVFEESRQRGLLVNVVDVPDLCNFEVPAVARRGVLTLAVSTSGSSPALAAIIRKRLEDLFGPEYGELTAHLGALRGKILRKVRDPKCRRLILKRLGGDEVLDALDEGGIARAKERIAEIVAESGIDVDTAGGKA
jgi:precorrin-2 dehydrogenase/sirohydrochlorin ferrochelatase